MRFIHLSCVAVFIMCLPISAKAQDFNTVLDIPAGQTLVNIAATERVTIEQDLLVANLRYEMQNDDPKVLQNDINKVMKAALDKAKATKDVKVSTGSYHIYPYDYDPDPKPLKRGELPGKLERTWRGSQSIELKGKKPEAMLDLVGKLQEMGLAMSGLNYTISPDLLEETQNSLLEAALEKLKVKAQRTAKALGKSSSDLLQVNVDANSHYPQPQMRTMAAMDGMAKMEMAAPVASPGESEINLTVTAVAIVKP